MFPHGLRVCCRHGYVPRGWLLLLLLRPILTTAGRLCSCRLGIRHDCVAIFSNPLPLAPRLLQRLLLAALLQGQQAYM
jgi:hypothetical protein